MSVKGIDAEKVAPKVAIKKTITLKMRNTYDMNAIVMRKYGKSKKNYSLLSASMGFIFAALYAG